MYLCLKQCLNKRMQTASTDILQKKWRGIHCEEYMLCVTANNNILEKANREEDMLCVTNAELHEELQDEDYAVFYCQPHCEKI